MKFKFDENLPVEAAESLRQMGHPHLPEVRWATLARKLLSNG
jgi:hypothetical protein